MWKGWRKDRKKRSRKKEQRGRSGGSDVGRKEGSRKERKGDNINKMIEKGKKGK